MLARPSHSRWIQRAHATLQRCRILLESGKPAANPFAALMGGGAAAEQMDEFGRPKYYRHYALGAVLTRALADVRGRY